MENQLPVPKNERYRQLVIYTISILFLAWDLFCKPFDYLLEFLIPFRFVFLIISFPLLIISWFLVFFSPKLGARIAFFPSVIGSVFYFSFCIISLAILYDNFFEILRIHLPRILSLVVTFLYSKKILHSPTERTDFNLSILFFNIRWTKKKQKSLVIASIIVFGILSVQWLWPRAICIVNGGKWIRDGIFGQAQYCLYEYSDAGKACQSSKDCMGACIIENYSVSLTVDPIEGVCAPNNRRFGCIDYFDNQEIFSICVD